MGVKSTVTHEDWVCTTVLFLFLLNTCSLRLCIPNISKGEHLAMLLSLTALARVLVGRHRMRSTSLSDLSRGQFREKVQLMVLETS